LLSIPEATDGLFPPLSNAPKCLYSSMPKAPEYPFPSISQGPKGVVPPLPTAHIPVFPSGPQLKYLVVSFCNACVFVVVNTSGWLQNIY
jgi:hypothetical protein